MQGVEGQIFGPMSRTYAYALLGAVIATFTVTPVMSSLLLPEKVDEVETIVVRTIRNVYQRVLTLAVKNARVAMMVALAFLIVCAGLGMRLGTNFAQAGRRQSLDPRLAATDDYARCRSRHRQQDSQRDCQLPAGAYRRF